MQSNTPIIDAHAHVAPPCVDEAIRLMDNSNIEVLVDMTPYTDNKGTDFPGPNTLEEAIKAFSRFPGRFVTFCGIDFEGFGTARWLGREKEALKRHLDAGAVGIKLWKTLGLHISDSSGKIVAVDDERLAPLLNYAQELGAVIAIHIADPQGFFEPLTPDNERLAVLKARPEWWFGDRRRFPYDWWQLIKQLERVVSRHRKGTLIGAHFGCAAEEMDYVADIMRQNPHYIVDIAARLQDIGRYEPSKARAFFEEFQDRILFATDAMLVPPLNAKRLEGTVLLWDHYREYFETADREIDNPSPPQMENTYRRIS